MRIRERAKGEVIAQAGGPQLGPTNSLKVSRGDPKDLPVVVQGSNELSDRRASLRAQVFAVGLHLGAHSADDAGKLSLKRGSRYPGTLDDSAQNADVGITVHVDTIGIRFDIKDLAD